MTGATIAETPPRRPTRSRPAQKVLAVLAVVLAAVLAAGGWYWVTHPRALSAYGDAVGGPALRGRAFSDVMLFPNSDDGDPNARTVLTVTSLTPRIEENTAGAVIVIFVCRSNSPDFVETMGIFTESPASSCSQLHPLSGSERLTIGDRRTRIIAQITTRRAGRIHIEGYDITYRQGIRRGRQHVGMDSTFTVA